MAEIDPFAVLGVARTASREEIARAYRRLAKQNHPDAGATAPTTGMARINEAWHILSDPIRRARWERLNTVIAPPNWVSAPAEPSRRPRPMPEAPPSPMDSGWVAIGVLGGVVVVVAALMIGVSMAAQPSDDGPRFVGEQVSFEYPPDWNVAPGDGTDPVGHQVLAHLVTYSIATRELCTSFTEACNLGVDDIPPGEASILMTVWEGGSPPVPDPVTARPYGLDADRIIGGNPAAFEIRDAARESAVAWWQLSPTDFPDRWIEVRADIAGLDLERADMIAAIDEMLATLEFTD